MKKNEPPDSPGGAILVVDDDPMILDLYRRLLKKYPRVLYAASGTEALRLIREADDIAVALVDFDLPGASGLEVIQELKKTFPASEEVVVTASYDVQSAVESIKAGAARYITKPFNSGEIISLIDKNMERQQLREELARLKDQMRKKGRNFMVVGRSKRMQQLMELVESTALLDTTVLILGETGTGKDLLARIIHEKSSRAKKSLVVTDCAVLSERLIESDLFGHEKGAFTGARDLRRGKFERADGGTIFLNEICTLPLDAQAKLLRVIEDGELERVGGSATLKVNVRVIAASNTDLETAVNEGKFRRDLFHRLNIITLYLPPLRERREDIPLLVDHFLSIYAGKFGKEDCSFTEDAYDALFTYSWPGNIRELENAVERAVITAQPPRITVANLPPLLFRGKEKSPSPGRHSLLLAENEETLIREALKKNGSNLSKAAEDLGIARGTLYSKMKKYGL